jgi:4-diphosphocytidyl-2-C-methyl-D-erythritol kinase
MLLSFRAVKGGGLPVETIKLKAHAKINLYLEILGRRSDGFHEIKSVMCLIGLHDDVRIEKGGKGLRFECKGLDQVPADENLAFRAAGAFFDKARLDPGLNLTVEKNIPWGAGLGGGSSDAAAVLAGLDRMFPGSLTREKMQAVAASLGSDVPFFLHGRAAMVCGRGERVLPAGFDIPAFGVVLVKPPFGVSTAWAYRKWDEKGRTGGGRLPSGPDPFAPENLFNSFEDCVFAEFPMLHSIRKLLVDSGALGVQMSGSGSTLFGLFPGEAAASAAAGTIKSSNTGLWVHATTILDSFAL